VLLILSLKGHSNLDGQLHFTALDLKQFLANFFNKRKRLGAQDKQD
jgi:hypothetical protein